MDLDPSLGASLTVAQAANALRLKTNAKVAVRVVDLARNASVTKEIIQTALEKNLHQSDLEMAYSLDLLEYYVDIIGAHKKFPIIWYPTNRQKLSPQKGWSY